MSSDFLFVCRFRLVLLSGEAHVRRLRRPRRGDVPRARGSGGQETGLDAKPELADGGIEQTGLRQDFRLLPPDVQRLSSFQVRVRL